MPVVAIVQGDAIAGGNELALHCDFVVASEEARFGMSLAQIGLAPTWFLAKKLLEAAGPVTTREILLLGDPLPATRMYELGVIARVAPADELEASAAQIIDRLAKNAPLSLRAMKALIVREMAFRDGIDHADVDALVQQARETVAPPSSAGTNRSTGVNRLLERHEPASRGHGHGLGPRRHLQLAQDRTDVELHRVLAHQQPLGDATVRLSGGNES